MTPLGGIPRLAVKKLLNAAGLYEQFALARIFSRQFVSELGVLSRHKRGCRKARLMQNSPGPLRLEIGGGEDTKKGWFNVDLHPGADLTLDLRRPLPFPDGSVDAIYSEHVLEHFSCPGELTGLLSECYRVLKPGGEFYASVPDFGRAVRLYAQGDEERFRMEKFWSSPSPCWCKNAMDDLNWLMYMGGVHKFMFDGRSLVDRLIAAGFDSARLREFDPALDSHKRKHQSIYAVAVK